jgi:hypothetical protein
MSFIVKWIPNGRTRPVNGPQSFAHLVEAVAFARAVREWAPVDIWIEDAGQRIATLSDLDRLHAPPQPPPRT